MSMFDLFPKSDNPHEYSADEVLEKFLRHVERLVEYWHGIDGDCRRRMEGLAFSILTALDGGAADLPAFIVAPNPHPEDKAFLQEEGCDWYPENHEVETQIKANISGGLHELLWRERGGR